MQTDMPSREHPGRQMAETGAMLLIAKGWQRFPADLQKLGESCGTDPLPKCWDGTHPADILILDSQLLELQDNKFLSLSHPVCGILLRQLWQTNTLDSMLLSKEMTKKPTINLLSL